ncbi:hypothetical protein SCANM124S_03490 [Streptomyces canus]
MTVTGSTARRAAAVVPVNTPRRSLLGRADGVPGFCLLLVLRFIHPPE